MRNISGFIMLVISILWLISNDGLVIFEWLGYKVEIVISLFIFLNLILIVCLVRICSIIKKIHYKDKTKSLEALLDSICCVLSKNYKLALIKIKRVHNEELKISSVATYVNSKLEIEKGNYKKAKFALIKLLKDQNLGMACLEELSKISEDSEIWPHLDQIKAEENEISLTILLGKNIKDNKIAESIDLIEKFLKHIQIPSKELNLISELLHLKLVQEEKNPSLAISHIKNIDESKIILAKKLKAELYFKLGKKKKSLSVLTELFLCNPDLDTVFSYAELSDISNLEKIAKSSYQKKLLEIVRLANSGNLEKAKEVVTQNNMLDLSLIKFLLENYAMQNNKVGRQFLELLEEFFREQILLNAIKHQSMELRKNHFNHLVNLIK